MTDVSLKEIMRLFRVYSKKQTVEMELIFYDDGSGVITDSDSDIVLEFDNIDDLERLLRKYNGKI